MHENPFFALSFVGVIATTASAQDFLVRTYHINPVRSPQTLVDELAECTADAACGALLASASASVGVPIGQIVAAAAIAKAQTSRRQGEQEWFEWPTPANYATCRVAFFTNSIVPEGHTRFAISANKARAGVFTQTPVGNWTQGRSWYDGIVTITYIAATQHAAQLGAGNCNIGADQFGYSCTSRATGCNGLIDLGVSKKTVN